MTVGLYRAAVAMVSQERRLDVIASNLANVGTTGFKRSRTAGREFRLPENRDGPRGMQTQVEVDFTQGDLVKTNHRFDLGLTGSGFFALDGPDGELYTRDGEFELTEQGVLVNRADMPVSWEVREAAIDPAGDAPIVIGPDGSVRQGAVPIGKLRIVDFADHSRMQGANGGHWSAPRGLREVTHTARVHQFSLEQSNAVGTEEIIEMIGVQRSFEATANLIKSIQRSYSRLTRSA